jgi:lipid-A-disaccharide synthase
MRVWMNAGELSGDMHGGALLRAMQDADADRVSALGMGGMHLVRAGMETLFRVEALSVMGGTEVLTALPRAAALLFRIGAQLRRRRKEIDAVVLIDAPEFNFQVARIACGLGLPVYYYIAPKVWAWRTGRVRFLRRHVRRLFCILPFETDFYRRHGMPEQQAIFVGNPLVDLIDWETVRHVTPLPERIGIKPGSRASEVENLLPLFARTAEKLAASRPGLEFVCLRAPNMRAEVLRRLWETQTTAVPFAVLEPENRYSAMRSCSFLLVASGTAALEAALAGTPAMIAYKVSPLTWELGKRLVRVPYVGLPNLIMEKEVFPEYLQSAADPDRMAVKAGQWLDDPQSLQGVRDMLEAVRERCGPPGCTDRAARLLLDDIRNAGGKERNRTGLRLPQ